MSACRSCGNHSTSLNFGILQYINNEKFYILYENNPSAFTKIINEEGIIKQKWRNISTD